MSDFDIRLTPESQKTIEALARASKLDLRPTLRVIGIGYRKEVDLIFARRQSRGDGLKWPALSPKYAVRKAIEFPGMPILVRTGSLIRSMTQEGAPGNISVISKTGAVFGSSVSYGIYHDSNESRSGRLPQRNFSEPSERRQQIWIEQIRSDIEHNFEREGISVQGDIFQ